MQNSPALWDRLLAHVRPVFGQDAVVAGGAIRDYYLGLAPKDLDVFVNVPSADILSQGADFLSVQRGDTFILGMMDVLSSPEMGDYERWAHDNPGKGKKTLLGVAEGTWTLETGEEYDLNIIARPSLAKGPQALIEGFDMGYVQAAYLGDLCVIKTDAYLQDWRNHTATIMHNSHGDYDLSRKRFARFDKRNPGLVSLVDHYKADDDIFA